MKALLLLPPFWDPVCVPLGISSLKAYAERAGHSVDLFDFNTRPEVFGLQRQYFELGKRMFPRWTRWNIERNGTEMLALHQIAYLFARERPDYPEMVAEILNVAAEDPDWIRSRLNVAEFDAIFRRLFDLIDRGLSELLRRDHYDVLGCSLFNSTWAATLFIVERIKASDPRIRTVVGGPGPIMGFHMSEGEVLSFFEAHHSIDYLVLGEGEPGFLEVLETPDRERRIIKSGSRLAVSKPIKVGELPLPDYGELEVLRYLQLSVATSRGCPFECSFCAETVFWSSFSSISSSKAFGMLEELCDRYGRTTFYLCDSLANQVITPLTRDIRSSGRAFSLDCYLRPDPICCDLARTEGWKAGGLYRARLGMESASQRILDDMNKMTDPNKMSRSLAALSKAGILTSTLWIVGYPGETEQEFNETLRFIAEHKTQIYQSDAWLMQYHWSGLAGSEVLHKARGSTPRFSERLNDIFKLVPMRVIEDLSPQDRFARLERFVAAMQECSIPNPYSLFQWVEADRRWAELGRRSGWTIGDNFLGMNT